MSGLTSNPFADPSVQQAAATTNVADPNEEFNPFAQQAASANAAVSSTNKPMATGTAALSNDELFRRQEELEKKAQELRRKEQELERRQRASGNTAGGSSSQPHNWPPLPTFIPVEPCFYQDIDVEIPVQFQATVRFVYYVYLTYVLALTINIFASLLYVLVMKISIGILLVAIIQMVLFTPCSFLFWFRPVYKAFRNDSSFNFMIFFFVLFVHSIFTLIQALGFSQYACGWANAIDTFHESIIVGLIMLLCAIALSASFAGMVIALYKVHLLYRGAGFSIDKARKEFTDGVMADRNMQMAASGAAQAAATHVASKTINQTTQGRY